MPLSTIFHNIGQFYWWNTRRKPPTCRKYLTNFITLCCIEYTLPSMGFELTTLVVISTDCTGSCKSSYHTITTTNLQSESECLLVPIQLRVKCTGLVPEVVNLTKDWQTLWFLWSTLVSFTMTHIPIDRAKQLLIWCKETIQIFIVCLFLNE